MNDKKKMLECRMCGYGLDGEKFELECPGCGAPTAWPTGSMTDKQIVTHPGAGPYTGDIVEKDGVACVVKSRMVLDNTAWDGGDFVPAPGTDGVAVVVLADLTSADLLRKSEQVITALRGQSDAEKARLREKAKVAVEMYLSGRRLPGRIDTRSVPVPVPDTVTKIVEACLTGDRWPAIGENNLVGPDTWANGYLLRLPIETGIAASSQDGSRQDWTVTIWVQKEMHDLSKKVEIDIGPWISTTAHAVCGWCGQGICSEQCGDPCGRCGGT